MANTTSAGLIETAWKTYNVYVIHPAAGEGQRAEIRRAFYGGALVLFESMIKSLSPGTEETEGDVAMLKGISDELDAFRSEMETAAKMAGLKH